MGRSPCCERIGLKRGKWSAEEDEKLVNYINANGEGSWRSLPTNAGFMKPHFIYLLIFYIYVYKFVIN